MQTNRPPIQVQWVRGDILESRHIIHLAVVNADGELLLSAGDPQLLVYARSSAKPLQALELIRSGAADSFHLSDEEIAVACGSHSGSHRHVEAVRSMLWKGGIAEKMLQCGPQMPIDDEMLRELLSEDRASEPIYNNCSGKHAGMLLTAAHAGEDLENYLHPTHPIQQRIAANLCELTSLEPGSLQMGTDGCGAPAAAMTLDSLARAFARLALPGRLDTLLRGASERVTQAMQSHPEMIAGEGRFDTLLVAQAENRLICKSGAEGMFGAALIREGMGLALKVADGSSRAVPPAALLVLSQMDILDPNTAQCDEALKAFFSPRLKDTRGQVVGRIVPTFS